MWSSALPGRMSPREVKSPLVENSWKEEEEAAVLCPDIFKENGSPASGSVRHEYLSPYFHSPSGHANNANYIIIPLRSPHRGSFENHVLVQANQRGISCSPDIRSFYSASLKSDGSSQPYQRSPEKRFYSPGPICRICHEDDQEEDLISPCNCSGSLALIHKSCIEKWLSTSNSDKCELCMSHLPIQRQTLPFWQWFCTTGTTHGPQGFYADITCVVLLTPLCLISVYLCALGASDYMKHGVWEGTGLGILSFFLLATYLLWFYVTVRYHWKTLRQWRRANEVIQLDPKLFQKRNRKILKTGQNSIFASPMNAVATNFGNVTPQNYVHTVHNTERHAFFVNQNGQSFNGNQLFNEAVGIEHNHVLV